MNCSERIVARTTPPWLWIVVVLAAVPLLLSSHAPEPPTCRAAPPTGSPLRQVVLESTPRIAARTWVRPAPRPSLDEILAAIRRVESGGCRDEGASAVGDDGRAIGPYQIHRAYWRDSRTPGRFEDCFDARYARQVVLAYWRRYCPEALDDLDARILARVHNGGPNGASRESTAGYWRKVERELSAR